MAERRRWTSRPRSTDGYDDLYIYILFDSLLTTSCICPGRFGTVGIKQTVSTTLGFTEAGNRLEGIARSSSSTSADFSADFTPFINALLRIRWRADLVDLWGSSFRAWTFVFGLFSGLG